MFKNDETVVEVKKFNNNEIIKTYGVGIRTPHSPSLFID
jgi:hypothetical protein